MTAAQVLGEIVMEKTLLKKCTFCGGANHSTEKCFRRTRKEKEKPRAAGDSGNRRTEQTPRKCFRCGYEDHLIAPFTKPQKENEKSQKQVHFNEKVIMHATTAKITVTKKYMHLWHACLVMTNVLLEIFVTVHN